MARALFRGNGLPAGELFGGPTWEVVEVGSPAPPPERHVHLVLPPGGEFIPAFPDAPSVTSCTATRMDPASFSAIAARLPAECFLLFTTPRQYESLAAAGLESVFERRIVVVCDPAGCCACYVDSVPAFAHSWEPTRSDNFPALEGRFLTALLTTRRLAAAVVAAAPNPLPDEDWVAAVRNNVPDGRCGATIPYLASLGGRTEVVEASAVYVVRGDTILLAGKSDTKALVPGRLYLPGGKLDPGESPAQCARRELEEETGLVTSAPALLDVTLYPDPRTPSRLYRFFQFVAADAMGAPIPRSDLVSCEWVKIGGVSKSRLFGLSWSGMFAGTALGLFGGRRPAELASGD